MSWLYDTMSELNYFVFLIDNGSKCRIFEGGWFFIDEGWSWGHCIMFISEISFVAKINVPHCHLKVLTVPNFDPRGAPTCIDHNWSWRCWVFVIRAFNSFFFLFFFVYYFFATFSKTWGKWKLATENRLYVVLAGLYVECKIMNLLSNFCIL